MKKLQTNPFRFGDPVQGDYYLPRPELGKTVFQFLKNRVHVVLIGPRRFGKTSFTLNLLESSEKQSYTCFFIDIFNITSHKDFLQQTLRAMKSKKGWKRPFKELIDLIPNLRPKILAELDSLSGQPSLGLTFDKSSDKDVKELIQDVLAGMDNIGQRVIIAIDEFQKIAEIDDQGLLE